MGWATLRRATLRRATLRRATLRRATLRLARPNASLHSQSTFPVLRLKADFRTGSHLRLICPLIHSQNNVDNDTEKSISSL
ncbi:pentapeptide repeat-containing protein [Undibacterium fentianense]|uniref:pentapeptide repeat-containing protein n=1 Tax=Undibacterium fentianense TaxID=2828728 RepID=UPI0034DD0DD0